MIKQNLPITNLQMIKEHKKVEINYMRVKIKLNNVQDAILFVTTCSTYDCDIDYMYDERYILDAKSLVSVIGAGLERICDVKVNTDNEGLMKAFLRDVKMWIYEDKGDK